MWRNFQGREQDIGVCFSQAQDGHGGFYCKHQTSGVEIPLCIITLWINTVCMLRAEWCDRQKVHKLQDFFPTVIYYNLFTNFFITQLPDDPHFKNDGWLYFRLQILPSIDAKLPFFGCYFAIRSDLRNVKVNTELKFLLILVLPLRKLSHFLMAPAFY